MARRDKFKTMTREGKGEKGKGERVNGEARPAAGAAVFGACRAELAVTVCATGRKGRGGRYQIEN